MTRLVDNDIYSASFVILPLGPDLMHHHSTESTRGFEARVAVFFAVLLNYRPFSSFNFLVIPHKG